MTLVPTRVERWPDVAVVADGGDHAWSSLVPLAWRALADPESDHLWPVVHDDDHGLACRRFAAALEVLWTTTGWPRLDLGAKWWMEAGYPDEHSGLALVRELAGDQLEELVAWLISSPQLEYLESYIAEELGLQPVASARARPGEAWVDRVADAAGHRPSPLVGGTDPLHLCDHVRSPLRRLPDDTSRLIIGSPEQRGAVLMTSDYMGWYKSLTELGEALPELPGQRSWRVQVVCTPVGHLGEYRRSRLTGRWFAGRHHVHQHGC
jgi:hypothetical protein